MRILIANSFREVVGGTETYLQVLVPSLLRQGGQISLVCEYSPSSNRPRVDAPDSPLPSWCLEELGINGILERVSAWGPDVVYVNGLFSYRMESALLQRYPAVLFAHNYYRTCGTGTKCHAFPGVQPCARRFGPMCLLLHYPRRCGGLNPWTMLSTFRRKAKQSALLSRYRAVLVASRHMYDEFAKHGISPDRLQIAPLFPTDVWPESDAPIDRYANGRILFLGRLTGFKGVHYLLRAMPRAAEKLGRSLTLTVGGDGPERQRLVELSRRLGLDVEFAGWLDRKRRLEVMQRSDLLVVPSLWPEPFGLVGLEAACVGLPAVAYAIGGVQEWLVPGISGELAPVDPPTVGGLAEAIARALSDQQHYASLRRGAWEVSKRFTVEGHLETLRAVLERVASPALALP